MDNKNLIAAISLSAAVIVLYTLFFQPPPDPNKIKKDVTQKTKTIETTDTPSLEKNESSEKLTREDALMEDDRIKFENNNIFGSISLKGAVIDDLTFKGYNIELNSNKKITLLNPRKVDDGYLIESGFVTTNKNIDTPNSSTIWKTSGNKN